ncbi:glycerol-3-phosphate 1-O-acyltransferase PlsB, partial [Pseudomonas aeruginosa]
STPIHLGELVEKGKGHERTLRMGNRILRVHFRNLKTAVMGPDLLHRLNLVDGLLLAPLVSQAISGEWERDRICQVMGEGIAMRYANVIAPDFSYTVIRFLEVILSWFWIKLYEGV